MSSVRLDIKGDEALQRAFEKLPDRLKRNTLLRIQRKAMKPLISKARSKAPVSSEGVRVRYLKSGRRTEKPGQLKRSIKNITSRSKAVPAVIVGHEAGFRKKNDGFYAIMLAKGKYGTKTGQVHSPIDDAWKTSKESIFKEVTDNIWNEVAKNWK